jgi:hypothetical protein
MAEHRAEEAIEKSLTESNRFAGAVYDLIGNFVGAARGAGKRSSISNSSQHSTLGRFFAF